MADRGRDSKWSEELEQTILDSLKEGQSREGAATAAGISIRTFERWMARGRRGEEPFVSFMSGVKKAEHVVEKGCIQGVIAIGHGGMVTERTTRYDRDGNEIITEKFSHPQWTALAWWLERKFPDLWGKDTEVLEQIKREYRRKKGPEGGA